MSKKPIEQWTADDAERMGVGEGIVKAMRREEKVLGMAREIRRGEAHHSPSELYKASEGDSKLYNHAMREAGYVVVTRTGEAPATCDVCGHEFGKPKERTTHPGRTIASEGSG